MLQVPQPMLPIQHATENLAEIIKAVTLKSPEQTIALLYLELAQFYAEQATTRITNRTS